MQTIQPTHNPLPPFARLQDGNSAKLLVESSKLFARTLDAQLAYETFRHIVKHTMECDGILVSSYSAQTGTICCVYAFVDGEFMDASIFPPVKFEPTPGRGMQSEVIRTGEPRLFGDVVQRVEEGRGTFYTLGENGELVHLEKGDRPKTQSAIMVPVKVDDHVIGVAQISKDYFPPYTEEQMLFVEGLALQMAAAIKNAELFKQMQDEIAERIRVEKALREREEEVERLNQELEIRVQERTEELRKATADMEGFCYSVSHDLRTPLRGISGAAMMLMEDYGEKFTSEGKEHLKSMRASANKMSKLIDGLLNFSRLGRHQMQPHDIDLSLVAERLAMTLKRVLESKAEVSVQPGMHVFGDQQMITMAMENLISNAVKFSSKVAEPKIEIGCMSSDGQIVYFVKDNGAGFEQEFVGKLFKPFERLHRDAEFPGTGIGLANAKRVFERHEGRVWAEGRPGQGATIYFTIGLRDES